MGLRDRLRIGFAICDGLGLVKRIAFIEVPKADS